MELPTNWPADAGLAAWVGDDDGLWWRAEHHQELSVGRQQLQFHFTPQVGLWQPDSKQLPS